MSFRGNMHPSNTTAWRTLRGCKWNKRWANRLRLFVSICLVSISVFVIALSYFTARDITDFALDGTATFARQAADVFTEQTERVAVHNVVSEAQNKAAEVEIRLARALSVVSTLAHSLEGMRTSGAARIGGRETVTAVLESVLKDHPDFSLAFTCWEPDAFDAMDMRYANTAGHDLSGRFAIMQKRDDSGRIVLRNLKDYTNTDVIEQGIRRGEFYLALKDNPQPQIVPLHPYRFEDGEAWLSSAVAPIIENSEVVGAVGISFRLDFMLEMMLQLKQSMYRSAAEASVVTSKGLVVASSMDKVFPGTHISVLRTEWRNDLQDIAGGSPFTRFSRDKLVISIPITLDVGVPTGSVYIVVPEAVVTEQAMNIEETITSEVVFLSRNLGEQRDSLLLKLMGISGVLVAAILLTLVLMRRLFMQESELQESEERLQSILENASASVFVKDLEGRYVHVNPALAERIHLPEESIIGKTDFEMFPREVAEMLRRNDKATLNAGAPLQWEETVLGADGPVTFVSTKFPLKDTSGKVYALCGIGLDITDRKQSETRLQDLERYLSDIIDSMPSILVGVDAEGGVTHWNVRAQDMFGIPRDEALSRQFVELLPEFAEQWPRIREAIRTMNSQPAERKRFRSGGVNVVADVTIYPLQRAEGTEAVLRIDDVTTQMRIEEVMIQTEKMLSVGGLAAGMAHEINNPLGAILQGAQNIERRISLDIEGNRKAAEELGCPIETIREYLEQRKVVSIVNGIRDAGIRAARIVENMLNFSRKSETQRGPNALDDIITHAVELARSDYDLKKKYDVKLIHFELDFDDEMPEVVCIGTEIEQVLLNLFKNAAQAMTEAGTSNPVIAVHTRQEYAWAVIEVEDNGPGMSYATRRRIFEPFFTTKPPGLGTGLGLSVSYFIITQNHGGTITVESEHGKGTTFTIRLPIGGYYPESGV